MKKIALMPHIFGEAGGASIQFISKPGDVTVARLFRSNGKYVLGCFEGTAKMYPLVEVKRDYILLSTCIRRSRGRL